MSKKHKQQKKQMSSGRRATNLRPHLTRPAFLVTLLIGLGLVGQHVWQEMRQRQRPPLVEKRLLTRGTSLPFYPPPTLLLENKSRLGLTVEQRKRMEALVREWKHVAGPLEEDMQRAAEDFRQFASREAQRQRASLIEVQRRAAPVAELTREYRNLKHDYWQRAMQLLSPVQRQRAARLRQEMMHSMFARKLSQGEKR